MLQAWQPFYSLIATAAATLAGLLFVGITFSVGAVKGDVEKVVRVWGEPPLYDFIQVLLIGLAAQFPGLNLAALAWALLVWTAWRLWRLGEVVAFLHSMGPGSDLVFEDWLEKAIAPAALYLLLAASGLAFLLGYPWGPLALALDCVGVLFLGIYSTWTQLVWMAQQKAPKPKGKS